MLKISLEEELKLMSLKQLREFIRKEKMIRDLDSKLSTIYMLIGPIATILTRDLIYIPICISLGVISGAKAHIIHDNNYEKAVNFLKNRL